MARHVRAFGLRKVLGLVTVIVFAGIWFVPKALARLSANTINPVATISQNGYRIHVTGPVACDQTQPVFMRVTVTQRTTGAIAEGYAYFIGTVAPQQWHVNATALGTPSFEPGPATVVALARSMVGAGHPDDAHQWLVNVTLVSD